MNLDFNQKSQWIYIKFTDVDGVQRSYPLPIPKKPPGWEDMEEEELNKRTKSLHELAMDVGRALMTLMRGELTYKDFMAQMNLFYKRLAKLINNTPIDVLATRWLWEQVVRNRPSFARVKKLCTLTRGFLRYYDKERKNPSSWLESSHFSKYLRHVRENNLYGEAMANYLVETLRSLARAIDPTGYLGQGLEKEATRQRTRKALPLKILRKIMKFLANQGPVAQEWFTVILLVLYTPMRPSAACRLKIAQINFLEEKIAYFDKGKNRTTAMNRLLLTHLKHRCKVILRKNCGPWLNPVLAHTQVSRRSAQFGQILRAVSVPMNQIKPKHGRLCHYEHCLYDLRHTFTGWVFGLTRSRNKTRVFTNHDTDAGLEPYLDDDDPFVLEQQRKLLNLAPKVV